MLKKLNKFLQKQPKVFVYADAAYDNKLAVIGYITSDLTVAKYELVSANNVNDAELKAVELAHRTFPNSKIATDSHYAIENTEGDYVFYVERKSNLANIIARSAKEMAKSKVVHKL